MNIEHLDASLGEMVFLNKRLCRNIQGCAGIFIAQTLEDANSLPNDENETEEEVGEDNEDVGQRQVVAV